MSTAPTRASGGSRRGRGLSARTVQYALRRLVDTGVVTADEGGRRGTRGYTLGVPWGVHQLHPRRARGCKSCTRGVHQLHPNSQLTG